MASSESTKTLLTCQILNKAIADIRHHASAALWWVTLGGDGFYGSNDPTNSVKALKDVVVIRTGINPTRSTSRVTNLRMRTTHSNTQYKMNLSTVKWAQW